jgi:mono/diheme cytochrome c family protein
MSTALRSWSSLVALCGLALLAVGCRGGTTTDPPIHYVQNMDNQARYDMQEPSDLFEDKRAMRPRVEGTVATSDLEDDKHLQEDDHLYRGQIGGAFASTLPASDELGQPMKLDSALMERGKERYNIYCTPCHDGAGTGDGIVVKRGMMKPPSLHDERILAMPIGQIYDVIANGARNMPSYAVQVPVGDRWAIASYVRVLQLSRRATLEQIPADQKASRRWVQ